MNALQQVEQLLGPKKLAMTPFGRAKRALLREAERPSHGKKSGEVAFSAAVLEAPYARYIFTGGIMEETDGLLKAVNAEVTESLSVLTGLADQIAKTHAAVLPLLLKQTQEIRAARMTAVSEMQMTLSALRDVRAFFLESDYDRELGRLERLVALCREIQALKASGIFDAVCDSALRLAVKERS